MGSMKTFSLLLPIAVPSDISILNFACTTASSHDPLSFLNVTPLHFPNLSTVPATVCDIKKVSFSFIFDAVHSNGNVKVYL